MADTQAEVTTTGAETKEAHFLKTYAELGLPEDHRPIWSMLSSKPYNFSPWYVAPFIALESWVRARDKHASDALYDVVKVIREAPEADAPAQAQDVVYGILIDAMMDAARIGLLVGSFRKTKDFSDPDVIEAACQAAMLFAGITPDDDAPETEAETEATEPALDAPTPKA